MIEKLFQILTRQKIVVEMGNLREIRPVSNQFGTDRGTPIDRYYIERFLQSHSGRVQGRILEVGESHYARKFGSKAESIDVIHPTPGVDGVTIEGDLTRPETLPENAIDCFICTQTFNFIFDVQKAISGAHYLLKPGGVLLATVAGISQVSRYDMDRWGDYWRFTTASVQKLFEPVFTGGVEIVSFGNVLAATAFLQGIAVEDFPDVSLLDQHDLDYQMLIGIVARKVM